MLPKTHHLKKFSREACPQTPLVKTPGYATRRKQLRGMQLAQPPKSSPPLGKSYILPWTTTKKFI